jgi:hypothetical protein
MFFTRARAGPFSMDQIMQKVHIHLGQRVRILWHLLCRDVNLERVLCSGDQSASIPRPRGMEKSSVQNRTRAGSPFTYVQPVLAYGLVIAFVHSCFLISFTRTQIVLRWLAGWYTSPSTALRFLSRQRCARMGAGFE